MALWKVTTLNKYGHQRYDIMYRPDGEGFSFKPKGLGSFVGVQRFKYESKSFMNPGLFVSITGKKYMVPDWVEVLPETTINDIKPHEPETRGRKIGKKEFKFTKEFKSNSSNEVYTVTYYKETGKVHCTCKGAFRAKDGKCKHIKAVEKEFS